MTERALHVGDFSALACVGWSACLFVESLKWSLLWFLLFKDVSPK